MRHIVSRSLWQCLLLFFALALTTQPALAHEATPTATGYSTYTNPAYGFTIQYPSAWQIVSSVTGLPTFVAAQRNAPCQVDIRVANESGSVQDALAKAVPPDLSAISTNVAGYSAIRYRQALRPSSQSFGMINADVDTIIVGQQVSATGVTLYSLVYTLYRSNASPTDAAQCATRFQTMSNSFKPGQGALGMAPTTKALTSTTASTTPQPCTVSQGAVQYAENWWNCNEYNATSGPYCASVSTSTGTEVCTSTEYYGVTQSGGYFQPDFQCAEFVSRSLASSGLIPGLTSSSAQWGTSSFGSYTYPANGKTYDLNYVPSLYSFLMDSGIGTAIGNNPGGASPGDVVIYTDGSGTMAHTTLIVATGNSTLVDSHNAAGQHWTYDSFTGLTPNIIHIHGAHHNAHNDVNGDGMSDTLAFYNQGSATTGIYDWLTTGTGTTVSYQGAVWSSSGFDWTKAKWVTGDFNGDGRTDVMAFYNLGSPAPYNVPAVGLYEWLSTGSGFSYQGQIWNSLGLGGFDWTKATFGAGDINSDGKSDALAFYNLGSATTGIYEWLTTGSGTTVSYQGAVWSSSGFDWTKAQWAVGDFNGDGRTDVMAFYNLGSPAPYNVPAVGLYEWLNNGSNGLTYEGQIWNSLGLGTFDWTQSTLAS